MLLYICSYICISFYVVIYLSVIYVYLFLHRNEICLIIFHFVIPKSDSIIKPPVRQDLPMPHYKLPLLVTRLHVQAIPRKTVNGNRKEMISYTFSKFCDQQWWEGKITKTCLNLFDSEYQPISFRFHQIWGRRRRSARFLAKSTCKCLVCRCGHWRLQLPVSKLVFRILFLIGKWGQHSLSYEENSDPFYTYNFGNGFSSGSNGYNGSITGCFTFNGRQWDELALWWFYTTYGYPLCWRLLNEW